MNREKLPFPLIFLFLLFTNSIFSQNIIIPDVHLKKVLQRTNCVVLENMIRTKGELKDADLNNDGEIQLKEAEKVVELKLDCSGVESLEGLVAFKNLKKLSLVKFNAKQLVIKDFKNLQELTVHNNELEELVISDLSNLEKIDCGQNGLRNLRITGSPKLTEITCSKNELTAIDLRNLNSLLVLNCSNNKLSNLELNHCPNLEQLYFSWNEIDQIELQELKKIKRLDCGNNNLSNLEIPHRDSLEVFYGSNNILESLDFSGAPVLNLIRCERNKISKLNLKACQELNYLHCNNNNLGDLDLEGLEKLNSIDCSHNKIKTLNLKFSLLLKEVDCSNNELSNLDLRDCRKLTKFNCNNNVLVQLELKGCIELIKLSCINNQFELLRFPSLPSLTRLDCSKNKLTELDISLLKNLEEINLSHNKMTSYQSPSGLAVSRFNCEHNDLASIDVSSFKELRYLECSNNKLRYLDLSGLRKISWADCNYNELLRINIKDTDFLGKDEVVGLHVKGNYSLFQICRDDADNDWRRLNSMRKENRFIQPKLVAECVESIGEEEIALSAKRAKKITDSLALVRGQRETKNQEEYRKEQEENAMMFSKGRFYGAKILIELGKECRNPKQILSVAETYDSYLWVQDGAVLSTSETYSRPREGWVKLYLSDGKRAGLADSIEIKRPLSMVAIIEADFPTFCKDPIALTVKTDKEFEKYQWKRDGVAIGEETSFMAKKSGEYSVVVTDERGCTFENWYKLWNEIDPKLISISMPSSEICKGENIELKAKVLGHYEANIHTYNWYDSKGKLLSEKKNCIVNTPGKYQLVVDHVFACLQSKFVQIEECKDDVKKIIPKADYLSHKSSINKALPLDFAKQENKNLTAEVELAIQKAEGPMIDADGSKVDAKSVMESFKEQRAPFETILPGNGFFIRKEVVLLNQEEVPTDFCCQTMGTKEKADFLQSYVASFYDYEEPDLYYMAGFGSYFPILSTTQKQEDALVISNNSTLYGCGFLHTITGDKIVTQYYEYKPTKNFAKEKFIHEKEEHEFDLEEYENITHTGLVPTKVTKFELSTNERIKGQPIYGYCELETSPYFVDTDLSVPLKLKRKFAFYFKIVL